MDEFTREFDSAYGDFMDKLIWMRGSCTDQAIIDQEQEKLIVRCNEIYKKYHKIGVDPKQMEEYMHEKGLF